ncbi:hypothetical protein SDJN03_14330, partial [Cucurbita argyrosperma subsp. sororia]
MFMNLSDQIHRNGGFEERHLKWVVQMNIGIWNKKGINNQEKEIDAVLSDGFCFKQQIDLGILTTKNSHSHFGSGDESIKEKGGGGGVGVTGSAGDWNFSYEKSKHKRGQFENWKK